MSRNTIYKPLTLLRKVTLLKASSVQYSRCFEPIVFRSVLLNSRFFSLSSGWSGRDKKLFTPGPLGTAPSVKEAMLKDLGSRDIEFINLVKRIRSKLLDVAGVSHGEYTCIPIQGSGTYAVESVFQTAVSKQGGKALILANGAYGKRMAKICEVIGIPHHIEVFPEDSKVSVERVEAILKGDKSFTIVGIVQCETSSGVFNPVEDVGQVVKKYIPDVSYFIDAMSSFGAVPLDFKKGGVDYMVSSANKCLEGVPGFSYVIAKLDKLHKCKGNSRSLSLDVYDQYINLEQSSQFRFTPPTHTMLAFSQALKVFEEAGGLVERAKRYKDNRAILREGMRKLGFKEFLDSSHEGYIITSYRFPNDPNFDFKEFYSRLNEKDQVIYPGKVLNADCFRIGNIGYLFPKDMQHLLKCIEEVCRDMNIHLPIKN